MPKSEDGAAFRNMLRDTYVNLKPVVATENTAESGGGNTGLIVGIVVGAGRDRRDRRRRADAPQAAERRGVTPAAGADAGAPE